MKLFVFKLLLITDYSKSKCHNLKNFQLILHLAKELQNTGFEIFHQI